MSTHFYPRPASTTPSSPVRPSTAHSTIRAITPSPPDSVEKAFPNARVREWTPARPKSDGFAGTLQVHGTEVFGLGDELGGVSETPQRSGAGAGCTALVSPRDRSASLKKRPRSSPAAWVPCEEPGVESTEKEQERGGTTDENEGQERDAVGPHDQSDSEQDPECPYTPTPMPRAQKRAAYAPLGAGIAFRNHTPQHAGAEPARRSSPRCKTNTNDRAPSPTPCFPSPQPSTSKTPLPSALVPPPLVSRRPTPTARIPPPLHGPGKHISVSRQSVLSTGTAASAHSIFSTPGRDELERKKALVEEDEGPFARAVTMADLRERRREVSIGKLQRKGGEETREKGKRMWGCGGGGKCEVM